MILDSSAILAIFLHEPRCEKLPDRIGSAPVAAVGSPTQVETALGMSSRLRRNASALLKDFLRGSNVEVVPFGRKHYEAAVARVAGMPLLSTGNDFSRSDLARPDAED